jgi:hypothetical protein
MSLISIEPDGTGLFEGSFDASISGDGTQAAFTVAGGEGDFDVFVWDRFGPLGPRTVDLGTLVPTTILDTFEPAISADGLHVAFIGGTEITEGPFGPISSDIAYVFDRDFDQDGIRDEPAPDTRVVAVTSPTFTPVDPLVDSRVDPLQSTDSSDPVISGDGSTVAYAFEQFYDFNNTSSLEFMLSPLPWGSRQIVVVDRDQASGGPLTTELVSLAGPGDPNAVTRRGIPGFDNIAQNAGQCLSGAEGCGSSYTPDLSDDGRYVTFATEADNLVVDPASSLPGFSFCGDGGACDIVAVDRIAPANGGGPQHVNQPPGPVRDPATLNPPPGFVDRQVLDPAISADGRFITFTTGAEYFLGYESGAPTTGFIEPVDNNLFADVYLREWQPVVDTSPPVVFPDIPLGTTSAAQPAVLSTQDFGPAPIQSWTITGPNAGDFAWVNQQNCLAVVPPPPPVFGVPPVPTHGRVALSSNCSVFVAFTPTAVGPRNAVLQVVAGVDPFSVPGTQPQVFNIPLTGGGAVVNIPPTGQGGFTAQSSVDLGSQIVTTTSPEGTVTVTNTGTQPFQITNITLGGPNPGDFTIVDGSSCIGFLAAGASCTVRVTFTPTAPGERSATLVFTDTAPGGPHAVGLTGRAPLPTLIVNPGVTVPGRTVQIQGLNWAPNQIVVLTTADANDPTRLFAGSTEIRANAFGGLDGSVLFFQKTPTGPRIVIATGTPPTLTAFQPLLISVAAVYCNKKVTRG